MKYIIGLGNPGSEYDNTKHNIGFNVVKELAKELGIKINKEKQNSLVGKGRYKKEDVFLVLPQTFMNLSGKAIEELFRDHIKEIDDLVIVCDDINIELGKIRIKHRGSAGGQKGLKSVIRVLGRDDFARMRVGIATDKHKGDITDYVLSPFRRKDLRNVKHVLGMAKEACICWLENGVDIAMTKFNRRSVGTS